MLATVSFGKLPVLEIPRCQQMQNLKLALTGDLSLLWSTELVYRVLSERVTKVISLSKSQFSQRSEKSLKNEFNKLPQGGYPKWPFYNVKMAEKVPNLRMGHKKVVNA